MRNKLIIVLSTLAICAMLMLAALPAFAVSSPPANHSYSNVRSHQLLLDNSGGILAGSVKQGVSAKDQA
jgi:hypothetical protein